MPATRSRTSTEAPEVAVEEKKTEVSEQQEPENESEVKESVTEDKTESSAEQSSDSTSAEEKPVDKSEDNTNGSTTDALPSDTNGDQTEEKVENGSAKRKSAGDEGGDAPDSTDITPKKAKVDVDESNGTKDTGAGEETDKQTPVETTA